MHKQQFFVETVPLLVEQLNTPENGKHLIIGIADVICALQLISNIT